MDEFQAWQKIVGRLDETQQQLLKRFILNAMRQKSPAALWLHGPATSGKWELVRGISTGLGTVIVINGHDLERGVFALAPLYDYAAGRSVASLVIVKAGRAGRDFSRGLGTFVALVAGETVSIEKRREQPLRWRCDLAVLFVADVPPPEGSGLAHRVTVMALAALSPRARVSSKLFTAVLWRIVRRWALSS